MAAPNIAFDAPDNADRSGERDTTARPRPVDFEHLARQTMGDKALELEVLQLFARQSRQIVKSFGVEDADVRREGAHRLKGAALAVGAFSVATAAAVIEETPFDAEGLSALSAALLDAELFILKLCR